MIAVAGPLLTAINQRYRLDTEDLGLGRPNERRAIMVASNERGYQRSRAATGTLLLALSLAAATSARGAETADGAPEDFRSALFEGEPWLQARYRFEHVEQDGLPRDANANTIRLRLGYRTGEFHGFSVLAEGEFLRHLGNDGFNDTLNGKTSYPVVADPDAEELNQAYLAYTGLARTVARFGRQRFVLDNQRFIGDVGFRQNQQTFDGFTITTGFLPDVKATYGYLFEVQRIFGDDSPVGDFDTDSHTFNLQYTGFEAARLSGYGYLLDIADLPRASTWTVGFRLEGSRPIRDGLSVLYEGEAARQFDYADNPNDYDLGYYLVAAGVRLRGLTGKLGFEVLEGNGSQAFQTPFATLHKFQGWADKFLTTPPDGVEDLQISLSYVFKDAGWLDGLALSAVYHRFSANANGGYYGDELDLEAVMPLFKHFDIGLKYADYRADGFATDTTKLWLTLQAKF